MNNSENTGMTPEERINLENKIKQVFESVRPYLLADGGDIQFVSLRDDMCVEVFLTGACNVCNMSYQTIASVESALKNLIPEIKKVIALDYSL